MMRILFITDGRSPTALNWIKYFIHQGHEIHLVTLFSCQSELDFSTVTILPLRFSGLVGGKQPTANLRYRILLRLAPPKLRTWIRHHFVPASIPQAASILYSLIVKVQPDLVHAMRIPYEGMLTAQAFASNLPKQVPFLVSVWGNDFTLHAPSTKALSSFTKLTLGMADGLHTDCRRDQLLSEIWGFDIAHKPAVVLPGAGGIQLDLFYPSAGQPAPVVINPRGIRAYIRNDTFFTSIPLVLEKHPEVKFLCLNMAGQPEAKNWVDNLGIRKSTDLLPFQDRGTMADLYRQASVVVSPSMHDGTPNTLLEAMACGCFPVAGDIATIREWITPGLNGLVFNPADPKNLADNICLALESSELRAQAKRLNLSLIKERAEYTASMKIAGEFYQHLINLKQLYGPK